MSSEVGAAAPKGVAAKVPASATGGVEPMTIATRLVRERERLLGMTDEERAWRKQWLQDQRLSPNEPAHVPEYYKQRYNPIRRFYFMPLDKLIAPLVPVLGQKAYFLRYAVGKVGLLIFGVYATHYYFKYQGNDWTKKGGWRVVMGKNNQLPGDEGYGKMPEMKPSDYANRGFKNSPI